MRITGVNRSLQVQNHISCKEHPLSKPDTQNAKQPATLQCHIYLGCLVTGLKYVFSPHCIVMIAIGIPVDEGSSPLHILSSLISRVKLPCPSSAEETLSYKSCVIDIICFINPLK